MRPAILNPVFRSILSLKGVGPKSLDAYRRLFGTAPESEPRIADLIFHLPHQIIDRRMRPTIAAAAEGTIATMKVQVDAHKAPPKGRRNIPYRVQVHDDTGELTLVFFHAHASYLLSRLPPGETRYVSGRIEVFSGDKQIVHPDHMLSEGEFHDMPLVEPVYPLTQGLSQKILSKAITAALPLLPDLPEWQDNAFMKARGFLPLKQSLGRLHRPENELDISPQSIAWGRVAYDELLASQLALALVRADMRRTAGVGWEFSGGLRQKIEQSLPFSLTPSQAETLREIEADLRAPDKMVRLIQGDVGSGKTIVALLAMANVVEAGAQAALMAPTEILAQQHYKSLKPLADAAGLTLGLLIGAETAAQREPVLAGLRDGDLDMVIGTHAVFQKSVEFKRLGLAIVDEQHRFGVHQRLSLADKGALADMLVMTATPIPRTLVLTHFGDMDVSKLTEKPAGRKPIETRVASLERLSEVFDSLGDALQRSEKLYWVCPLVQESETLELTTAEERFDSLEKRFSGQVGLVHGQMSATERNSEMARFASGETRILVATTVIEVGVDVPDASIMVIEHAERFGLAQLHQLRGRVGRGDKASSCLLLYGSPLSATAQARLNVMRETEDGFRIAEEDLKLRGGGDLLGTRQSGTPGFHLARPEFHADLLEAARDDAKLIMETDPGLSGPRGEALRLLLYLFGRDSAIRLIKAG